MSGTYADVFGGGPVQPADVAFRAFTIAADTTLQWPVANQNTTDAAARIMDVTASTTGLTLLMPPADEVGNGMDALVRNPSSHTFTLADNDGSTIATVAPGVAKYVWVTDNTDAAGTWVSITFGTGSSAADAGALAGSGLIALGATLNQNNPVTSLVADYDVQPSDRGMLLVWNAGAGTLTLPAVGAVTNGFEFYLLNLGTGAVTVDPNGPNINETATLTVNPSESCIISTDVVAWYAIGQGRSVNFAYTQLNKSVAGSADVTLTSSEAGNPIMRFFGALTGNINVIVPAAVNQWTIVNDTTGAYSLTVKTASGTGVSITQGSSLIMKCDGTNVALSNNGSASIVSSFPDGSASAPGANFTSAPSYGFFLATNPAVGISANGVVKALFATGAITEFVQVLGATGSVAAPQYSFSTATQSGFYLASTAIVGVSVAGTAVLAMATSAVGINAPTEFEGHAVSNYTDATAAYTATGAVTLSGISAGQIHVVTLTATSTVTLPVISLATMTEVTLEVQTIQNGTGGYSVTFAADAGNSIAWTGATSQPVTNTNANKETDWLFRRREGSTVWRGSQIWVGV